MGACEEFVLQVKLGATQSGGAEISTEVYASQLGLGPGDDFEILLSADEQPGNWYALDPDATFVHVRDYYFDWQPREPATFVIERLDTQGLPADGITTERVAAMLDDAAHEVEHSLSYFNEYQAKLRRADEPNTFSDPAFVGRGVRDIQYSHAFVSLPDDQALVVEIDPDDASLWDVMLYNRAWYEALDYADSGDEPQPPSGAGQRRRHGTHRGCQHRPRRRELARHRGPRRGARHDPLVPPGRAADRARAGGSTRATRGVPPGRHHGRRRAGAP